MKRDVSWTILSEIFEGGWYTSDPGFKRHCEEKYPASAFANHMMPYAYDSVKMIVHGPDGRALEDYWSTDYSPHAREA